MPQNSINEINRRTRSSYSGASSNQTSRRTSNKSNFDSPDYLHQNASDYARNVQNYHEMAVASRHGGRKTLIIVLCALLAVLLACGVAFALYMGNIGSKLNAGNKSNDELAAIENALGGYSSLDEPFYMLLLGSDARFEGEMSRTDTNIVARVDPITNTVSMISIPRDTKIEIEGHGVQKFNAAYAFGKVPGVIEATEQLLDIEINHYAEVSFLDLKGLVDAVGGVTVENESRIDNPKCDDGDGNHYVIEEGTVTLNGGQALTFARNRDYPQGDFVRTAHQRQLIEAIVNSVLDAPLTSIPGIIEAASECVTTDLTLTDIIGLAQQFANEGDMTVYNAMLPSYTQNINGISFVINDEEKTTEMMELFEAGEDPSSIVSTKTASDITTSNIDTSNTLLLADDEEVVSGNARANTNTSTTSGTTGSNTGGGQNTSVGGGDGTNTNSDTPSTGTDTSTPTPGGSSTTDGSDTSNTPSEVDPGTTGSTGGSTDAASQSQNNVAP